MTNPKEQKLGASHTPQIKQLRRIEGQVRGVTKMIEDQRYCVDVLVQLKAIRASLSKVEHQVMNAHLSHCVHKAVQSKKAKDVDTVINEIKTLLKNASF